MSDRSLGRFRDLIANNVIDVKTSARHQHLATTVGNKVEVDLRSAGTEDVVIFDIDGKTISNYKLAVRMPPKHTQKATHFPHFMALPQ